MALQAGIVGLPNVGKSTIFNALTNAGAQAANFPFVPSTLMWESFVFLMKGS